MSWSQEQGTEVEVLTQHQQQYSRLGKEAADSEWALGDKRDFGKQRGSMGNFTQKTQGEGEYRVGKSWDWAVGLNNGT